MTIPCPECTKDTEIAEKPENATITASCTNCGEKFSYRMVYGKPALWEPPKRTGQRWKGIDYSGGKYGERKS